MFGLFVFYMILISAILPVAYVFLVREQLLDSHFFIVLASEQAFDLGHLYTIAAVIIFLILAFRSKPHQLSAVHINKYHVIYHKYAEIIFISACLSLLVSILLSLTYGMSPSNLVPQRPMPAIYLGYIAKIFAIAVEVYICFQLILFGKLSKKGWIILFLLLLNLAVGWSRSGLMNILFLYLLSAAYVVENTKIRWNYLIGFSVIGLCAVFLGQYFRNGEPFLYYHLCYLDFLPIMLHCILRFQIMTLFIVYLLKDNHG